MDTEERIAIYIFKKIAKFRKENTPELYVEIKKDILNLEQLGGVGLSRIIETFWLTSIKN